MGLKYMGKSELTSPMRCSWCGEYTIDLVKIRSKEDKATLRICKKHWDSMAQCAHEWDIWVARKFPKWGLKCMGRHWYESNGLLKLIEKKKK